ncbi:MAG TPA: Crp/Fnr family transcriptional regulator [Sphingomicrobium sp.]|jgi:CRP-like cAMP-binding protein
MPSLPLHRLNEFVCLEGADSEAFHRLAIERRRFKRHDLIRAHGSPTSEVFFLVEGWVACCVHSAAGADQIVKVHLPGDMLGSPSLALSRAAESLIALNRVVVDVIPSERLGELFARVPKFSAAMFLSAQQERIWLMDRLMAIGRTNAVQRLAGFLCSIHQRLQAIDPEAPNHFELPLSQRQLADVLGITTVHANRTFMQLDNTGLVSRSKRRITIEDAAGLRKLSCLPDREFQRMPAWLSAMTRPAGQDEASA